MKNLFSIIVKNAGIYNTVGNQNGSVIVIALIVLVLMSIIGVSSTDTSVTESLIVRNTTLRKQNVQMVDAAVAETAQIVLDAGYIDPNNANTYLTENEIMDATAFAWINDKDQWETDGNLAAWYNPDFVGRVLVLNTDPGVTDSNCMVPQSTFTVTKRGEAPDSIRCTLVGWEFKGSGNIDVSGNQPVLRTANILTEYISADYGIIRLMAGVEREFSG